MHHTAFVPRQRSKWPARILWAAMILVTLGGTASAQAPQAPQAAPQLRIYTLEHIRAEDIAKLFEHLLGQATHPVSNKLVVSATDEQDAQITALLKKLDLPENAAAKPKSTVQDPSRLPSLGPASGWKPAGQSETLRRNYEAAEELARNLQAKLKPSEKPIPADDPLRLELRAAVAKAFAARQRLLKAELALFQDRMDRLGRTIEQRERIADQIVDRRVEELLNPSLEWDGAGSTEARPGLPTLAAAATGDPAAAADLACLQGSWQITRSTAGTVDADVRGSFRFEKDRVHIAWKRDNESPERSSRVILRTTTNPRQIDFRDIADDHTGRRGIYSCEGDRLLLAFPLEGSSGDMPRPQELLPAKDVLYLELARQHDDPQARRREPQAVVSVQLHCTAKGKPLQGATVDSFRQAYQPGAVHPRVERMGTTRTDESGRVVVTLDEELWKREARSGYLIYVSGPDRGVQCLVLNGDSHIASPFPISVRLEFDRDQIPAPMVPPGHLAIASRRGVTITESRDKVEGFAFKDEGASEYITPAKTEVIKLGE